MSVLVNEFELERQFKMRDKFFEKFGDEIDSILKHRRQLYISELKRNFPLFCWEINRQYGRVNTKFHDQIIAGLYGKRRSILECFRGSAKTMHVCYKLLWRAWSQNNQFLIYTSGNEPQVKSGMRKMNRMIKRIDFLKEDLLNGRKLEIEFTNGSVIWGLTYGSGLRGFGSDEARVNEIIGDDVIPDKPKMMMSDYISIWMEAIEPAVEFVSGEVHCVGTPFREGDLYDVLMNDKRYYKVKIPIYDSNGRSNWEERFPTQNVKSLEEGIDYITFARQYLCECVNPKGNAFRREWLVDHGSKIPSDAGVMFLFVDLAVSESKTADYCGIIQVYHSESGKWYIVDSWAVKGIDNVGRVLKEREPHVDMIMIEAPGALHLMCQKDPRISTLSPGKVQYKKSVIGNKIQRIMLLEPWFKNGYVLFDSKKCHDFLKEYLLFPEGKDFHILDAFQMGVDHFSSIFKRHVDIKPIEFEDGYLF